MGSSFAPRICRATKRDFMSGCRSSPFWTSTHRTVIGGRPEMFQASWIDTFFQTPLLDALKLILSCCLNQRRQLLFGQVVEERALAIINHQHMTIPLNKILALLGSTTTYDTILGHRCLVRASMAINDRPISLQLVAQTTEDRLA